MRWINHQTTTALMVYAATGDVTAATAATLGSVAPDAIEFFFRGLLPHRSLTHWPYLYLALGAGAYWGWQAGDGLLFFYLLFFVVGALIHLAQDALSPGGIPWKHPLGVRSGLGLYVPFSRSEFIVALALVVIAGSAIWWNDYHTPLYLAGELERVLVVAEYFGRRLRWA
ncbi:metal-dependent hydrolase [Geoalkalibacter halelectricus]|uniref:metal-dependent hydrolase n=1 Tax=Geoalkalibacter halelectricus TaxID=2847045 RepID=UPI003D24D49A